MGIFFAILSPALYSTNNYIDKFLLEKYEINPILLAIYTGVISFFVAILLIIFVGFPIVDVQSSVLITLSGVLTALYILPYFKALSTDETSRVVPLFQFVPVMVIILSFIFLGETFSMKQYLGAILIIVAGFLFTVEKFELGIFKLRSAFWFMLLSSFLFALSIVLYKFGVKEISFWHTLIFECLGIILGALSILFYPGNYVLVSKEIKKYKPKVFIFISINESFYLLARYTSYFALSLIPASLVSVMGGFQPLFVLIFGIILSIWFPHILKEVIDKKTVGIKLVGIILIFLGLFAIFQ